MRPMDHSTLIVPLVLTVKLNRIALAKRAYPGRNINIMSNQKGLA